MHTQIDSHDGMSEQTAAPATATAAVAGGSAGWTRQSGLRRAISESVRRETSTGEEREGEAEMRGKTTGDGERKQIKRPEISSTSPLCVCDCVSVFSVSVIAITAGVYFPCLVCLALPCSSSVSREREKAGESMGSRRSLCPRRKPAIKG